MNKELIIAEKLIKYSNIVFPCKISKEFIIYRNDYANRFADNGRSPIKKKLHADALIIEYELLTRGLVEYTKRISSDVMIDNENIDFKIISTDYFNIQKNKFDYTMGKIDKKEVDFFGFFKYIVPHDIPFVAGDNVNIKLIDVREAIFIKNNIEYGFTPYFNITRHL